MTREPEPVDGNAAMEVAQLARSAVVIGAGYVGLPTAATLAHLAAVEDPLGNNGLETKTCTLIVAGSICVPPAP